MLQPGSRGFARTKALLAIFVLGMLLGGGLLSAAARQPNGAGLVIRHGDGRLVYAYVQFEEDSINGMDLLTRSGIDATIAPFGGLGGAVCSLNGEGCPSDSCFCHSYTSPAYYWNYFVLEEDGWTSYPVGASSRTVRDGDVDGWSWTAVEHGLPDTGIDEIAAMNNVDRSGSTATPTTSPEPDGNGTPVATRTAVSEPAIVSSETLTPVPTTQAVVVAPGATPEVLARASTSNGGQPGYLLFLAMAAVVAVAGGAAIVRNRAVSR